MVFPSRLVARTAAGRNNEFVNIAMAARLAAASAVSFGILCLPGVSCMIEIFAAGFS